MAKLGQFSGFSEGGNAAEDADKEQPEITRRGFLKGVVAAGAAGAVGVGILESGQAPEKIKTGVGKISDKEKTQKAPLEMPGAATSMPLGYEYFLYVTVGESKGRINVSEEVYDVYTVGQQVKVEYVDEGSHEMTIKSIYKK